MIYVSSGVPAECSSDLLVPGPGVVPPKTSSIARPSPKAADAKATAPWRTLRESMKAPTGGAGVRPTQAADGAPAMATPPWRPTPAADGAAKAPTQTGALREYTGALQFFPAGLATRGKAAAGPPPKQPPARSADASTGAFDYIPGQSSRQRQWRLFGVWRTRGGQNRDYYAEVWSNIHAEYWSNTNAEHQADNQQWWS